MLSTLLHPLKVAGAVLEGRSPKWPALERQVVKEEGECRVCGTKRDLQVHHVRPYHLFPALELVRSNLMTLCRRDHFFVGHLADWKAWNPDVRADAVAWAGKLRHRLTTRGGE